MQIRRLECPLNRVNSHRGPLTSEGISGFGTHYGDEARHGINNEDKRLYERLAQLPKQRIKLRKTGK
jgi:hypothetical protein